MTLILLIQQKIRTLMPIRRLPRPNRIQRPSRNWPNWLPSAATVLYSNQLSHRFNHGRKSITTLKRYLTMKSLFLMTWEMYQESILRVRWEIRVVVGPAILLVFFKWLSQGWNRNLASRCRRSPPSNSYLATIWLKAVLVAGASCTASSQKTAELQAKNALHIKWKRRESLAVNLQLVLQWRKLLELISYKILQSSQFSKSYSEMGLWSLIGRRLHISRLINKVFSIETKVRTWKSSFSKRTILHCLIMPLW